MSAGGKKGNAHTGQEKVKYPEPRDVIDGVPDRSAKARPWKYVALALVFLAWICFLVFCGIIGTL